MQKPINTQLNLKIFTLLILLIAIVILVVRKTDALVNPQFWAEDGTIYFKQQYEYGPSAVFIEYAGYLNLIARLIALVADLLPVPYSWIPAFYNYSSLILTVFAIACVFSERFDVRNKPLMALAIVLVPHYTNEVFLTITNLQWILALIPIIILLKENPEPKYGNIFFQYLCDLSGIVICGLSGPFMVFYSPLFIWKWIRDRSLYRSVILAAVVLVSYIQASIIAATSLVTENFSADYDIYSSLLGSKIFGGLFLGIETPYLIDPLFLTILLVSLFILLLFIVYQKGNRHVPYFLGAGGIILLSTLYKFSPNPEILVSPAAGVRYFYIPYVLITWSLIALLGKETKWMIILLLFILFSSISSDFRNKPLTDYNWAQYAEIIGKEDLIIPINPEGWQIIIPAKNE